MITCSAPGRDEIELTLFGPGYGEAIAVHLGGGAWILVDSCIDPNSKRPASASYLDELGVSAEAVKLIVASHWHDDHVRGISELAAKYPSADFCLSAVFNEKEALQFLVAYSGIEAPGQAKGTSELYKVVCERAEIVPALHRTLLLDETINGIPVRVTAWSPTPAAHSQAAAHFARFLPQAPNVEPIRHAPDLRENLEAVVLHLSIGDDAILLGSDLEDVGQLGWSALVKSPFCLKRAKASIYKIAHHGSATGDHDEIWSSLLTSTPHACLTPFNRGIGLPKETDLERIRSRTPNAFITSKSTRKPRMPSGDLKRLKDICSNLTPVNHGYGVIRLRKRRDEPAWQATMFGRAEPV